MSQKRHSPAAYADVKYVMDMAVKKPGLIYKCKTVGAAVNFKQRCNRYRNMLREIEAEMAGDTPGFRPQTAYDILVIRQQSADGQPSKQGAVLVFDHEEPTGTLIDPDTGEEIEIVRPPLIQGGQQ